MGQSNCPNCDGTLKYRADHRKFGCDSCGSFFTEEQVKAEARRCLGCGATTVDVNRCIGCGLCTTKCEFDAIKLHRDHPDASNMVKAEKKLGKIGPYAAKRQFKIWFGRKDKEA